MENYQIIIDTFNRQLKANSQIEVKEAYYRNAAAKKADLNNIRTSNRADEEVLDFYSQGNAWIVKWEPKRSGADWSEMKGSVNILPFEKVLSNWEGVTFFKSTPADSLNRRLFLIDFFVDEAAVGIIASTELKHQLYFSRFEGEPVPLPIKMKAYILLCIAAKGTLYWQYLLFELMEGTENPVSQRIKTLLPELFPDFSFDGFVKLFNDLRIR